MPTSLKLLIIAGARPNFMKIAPLVHALKRHNASRITPEIQFRIVHTGQHYDEKMSEVFFRELGIPAPDFNLEVGSGSHAAQTAGIMTRFEPVLLTAFKDEPPASDFSSSLSAQSVVTSPSTAVHDQSPSAGIRPHWVIVVGDVNSTMACTLVAAKLGIKVAHVEAGLRSRDRTMPEEINRVVTDALADLLLTPSADADENLRAEGVPDSKIRLVGNIMIDALVANLPAARKNSLLEKLGLARKGFVYVTLHRPSNVDHQKNLGSIMTGLNHIAQKFPVVFPMHPRTRKMLLEFGLSPAANGSFKVLEPVGYLDSLALTENARVVVTDSGGLQEESTYFRTPCLTLRPNTERPITIQVGSNRLTEAGRLDQDLRDVLTREAQLGQIPPLWDGRAAERIVQALVQLA